ncbi:hypothetical protein C0J52_22592 [Blattella germanica]|nr:hypothetical protein C0J52_22592 [Blattella germanica]
MAPTCSALTCKNRQKKGSGITFHSFPRNEVRRQKWLAAIQRSNWTPPSHAVICSVHFEEKYFDRTGQTVRLRENSVPTLLVSKTSYIRGKRYSSSLCQDKIVEKDAIPEAESENMTEERRNCDRVEIEDGEDLHSNQENGNQSEKLHKCKLCYFKTNYQSVMIYHLRQHLVTTRRCDFCSKKLPAHTLDQYRLNTNGNCESLSEGEGTAKSLNDLAEEEIVVQSITNCTEHEDCKCKTKSVDLESRSPKDTEMKIKYHPFEPESVEDMVEELHNTGQVSAFMNNSTYDCKSNNIQYKMKDPLEKKTDIGDTPDDFADECSHKLVKRELVNSQCKIKDTFDIRLNGSSVTTDECTHKVVKRELMNVDEISDQAIKESIVLNRNNALIDFLEVKRESPTS